MVSVEPEYCHQCRTELVTRAFDGRDRAYCPDCGHRHFRNAVPAVMTIVAEGRDVLLLEQPDGDETWELPGGHPEYDEEPRIAAARELEEETGVRAETDDLSLFSAVHSTHDGRHYNMLTYTVERSETSGDLVPGAEAAALDFWSVERILSTPEKTRAIDREQLRAVFER